MPIYTNEFINLTLEGIILLITFLVNLTIAIVVFLKNPRGRVNVVFSGMICSVALWNLTNFLTDSIRIWHISLAIGYWTLGTALFIPACFLYFSKIFPFGRKLTKWELFYIFAPGFFILLFIPSELNIVSSTYSYTNWGTYFETGILYLINTIYVLFYFIWSFVNLMKTYIYTKSKIINTQIVYIVSGAALSGLVGVFTNAILPIYGYHRACLIGTPFSIVFGLCTAYAITRYRFMDIKVVLKKSLVYALALGGLCLVVIFSAVLGQWLLQKYFRLDNYISAVIVVTFIVVFLPKLKISFETKFNNIFKKDYIDLSKKFGQMESRMSLVSRIQLENFCQELSVEMIRIFKLTGMNFFIFSKSEGVWKNYYAVNGPEFLKGNNSLIKILAPAADILIQEELKYVLARMSRKEVHLNFNRKELANLVSEMEKRRTNFIIPFQREGQLMAFIEGFGREGTGLSEEDVDLLSYAQERTKDILDYLVE